MKNLCYHQLRAEIKGLSAKKARWVSFYGQILSRVVDIFCGEAHYAPLPKGESILKTYMKKSLSILLSVLIVISVMVTAFSFTALAETEDYFALDDGQDAKFTIPLTFKDVDETSGIQLDLVSSDIEFLLLNGIDWEESVITGARPINPVQHGSRYATGIFTAANTLNGSFTLMLQITYKGDEPQTFTLTNLKFAQFDENGRPSWLRTSENHLTLNFSRTDELPDNGTGGDTNGGTGGTGTGGTGGGYGPGGHGEGSTASEGVTINFEDVPLFEGDEPEPVVTTPDVTDVFIDVMEGDWFHEYVYKVYGAGLMRSVSDSEMIFNPRGSLTRAMVTTVLYRIAEEPGADGLENPFTDVPAGAWYEDAVLWGFDAGVVQGFGEGIFGPNIDITREQMAAMMYRYAEFIERDVSASDDLAAFPDADSVRDYAVPAMQWAVAEGIITGSNGLINPRGTATRAEFAAVLVRFLGL